MMTFSKRRFPLVLFLGLWLPCLIHSKSSAQDSEIKALFQQLGSEDFETRARASQALLEMQPPPIGDIIRELLAERTDPEMKSRLHAVIVAWIDRDESKLSEKIRKSFADIQPAAFPHAGSFIQELRERLFLEDETLGLISRIVFDGDDNTNIDTLRRISEIGPEARAAFPVLIELLRRDRNYPLAGNAICSMGAEVIPQIQQALKDESVTVRLWTLLAIDDMANDAEPLVPEIIEALKDSDQRVRKAAIETLGRIKAEPAIPALTSLFSDKDPFFIDYAITAIREISPHAESAIQSLSELVRTHPDADVRSRALSALISIDDSGKTSSPAIAFALNDEGSVDTMFGQPVRYEALGELSDQPQLASESIPTLLRMLSDEQTVAFPWTFEMVSFLLANAGVREAIPALREKFEHPPDADEPFSDLPDGWSSTCVQVAAARALAILEPENDVVYEFLLATLRDKKWVAVDSLGSNFGLPMNPRVEAAIGLGFLGQRVTMTKAALFDAIASAGESESRLVAKAAWAIARLDPSDQKCIEILRGTGFGDYVRYGPLSRESPKEVAEILGNRIEVLIPTLWNDCVVNDEYSSKFCFDILRNAQPSLASKIAELALDLFESGNWEGPTPFVRIVDRYDGVRMIEWLIPELADHSYLIERLLTLAMAKDHTVRAEGARLLGLVGKGPESVVPALSNLLDDPRVLVRARAASALGQFGPEGKSALDKLRAATNDDYYMVRSAAQAAIDRISHQ